MVLFVWKGSPFRVLWVSAYLFFNGQFFAKFFGNSFKEFSRNLYLFSYFLLYFIGKIGFKIVNNCFNSKICSYLGDLSSFLYLNVVHFFNTIVN